MRLPRRLLKQEVRLIEVNMTVEESDVISGILVPKEVATETVVWTGMGSHQQDIDHIRKARFESRDAAVDELEVASILYIPFEAQPRQHYYVEIDGARYSQLTEPRNSAGYNNHWMLYLNARLERLV